MKMFRKEEGFTLVELMVVVLIIGILVAIAIPVFNSARANAEKRSCAANIRSIDGAIQQYLAAVEAYPASIAGLTATVQAPDGSTVGPFLKAVPECPSTPAAGGTKTYAFTAAQGNIPPVVTCASGVAGH